MCKETGKCDHTKEKNQTIEIARARGRISDLMHQDSKVAILNMFNELKDTLLKEGKRLSESDHLYEEFRKPHICLGVLTNDFKKP